MKRRLLIIAIFLLLGAVVNVGVAWECAISADMRSAYPREPDEDDNDQPSVSERENAWLVSSGWQGSADLIEGASGAQGFGLRYRLYEAYPRDDPFDEIFIAARFWAGWPLPSLYGEMWFGEFEGTEEHAISLTLIPHSGEDGLIDDHIALPTRVIWPGFALNTLFYAALLWLLIPGPFALRRFLRRRRGLCPKCAYPISESSVCTECGNPPPSRSRAA